MTDSSASTGTIPASLERGLGVFAALVAVLNGVAGLSRPAADTFTAGNTPLGGLFMAAILFVHALLYYNGARLRERIGTVPYIASQIVLVFIFGFASRSLIFTLVLYVTLAAQTSLLMKGRWSITAVAAIGVALFALNTSMASSIYRGSGVALLLALAGMTVLAIKAVVTSLRGTPALEQGAVDALAPDETRPMIVEGLTAREAEVLALVASGARNHEIAARLAISERTVKAHLASTYRKLGVETRAAAVAVAATRGVVPPPS